MSRLARHLPLLLGLALGAWLFATVPASPALGWDESMHALLPAARVAFALRAGEFGAAWDAVLDCAQYPPAWPLVLGFAQIVGGVDEAWARGLTSVAWAAASVLVLFVARGAARQDGRAEPDAAGWTAFALAALSPLAASYAGTLFLEVPCALATALALWTWQRRAAAHSAGRDWAAGAAIALGVFTKWNYGLLVAAALALDFAIRSAPAVRAGGLRDELARAARLAAPLAALALWWFVLPLPGGFDRAAEHRAALAGFLAGNLGGTPTPTADRVLQAAIGIGPTVRASLLVVVLFVAGLAAVRRSETRTLALVAGALLVPPLVHPFFLDRFLVPGLVPLFALAGVGFALVLPRDGLARSTVVGGLALLAFLAPGSDGIWLADQLGRLPAEGPARGYVEDVLRERARLGALRRLPTAGLARTEHDALLDLVAAEVRPGERVAWVGTSSEFSPAVLQLGLAQRHGDARWFLERDPPAQDLAYFGTDPGFDDAEIAAFAARFDVVLWTDPIDLRERRERAWVARVRDRLLAIRSCEARALGTVAIARPLRDPLRVTLYACRLRP